MQLKITQLEEQIRIAENHPRRSLSEESVVDVNQTGRKMSSAGFMPEGAQYPQQSIVDIYNEELHKLQRTAGEKIGEKRGGQVLVSELDQLKAMQKAIFEWRLNAEIVDLTSLSQKNSPSERILTTFPQVKKVYESLSVANPESFLVFIKLYNGAWLKELHHLNTEELKLKRNDTQSIQALIHGVIQLDINNEGALLRESYKELSEADKSELLNNLWDVMPIRLGYNGITYDDLAKIESEKGEGSPGDLCSLEGYNGLTLTNDFHQSRLNYLIKLSERLLPQKRDEFVQEYFASALNPEQEGYYIYQYKKRERMPSFKYNTDSDRLRGWLISKSVGEVKLTSLKDSYMFEIYLNNQEFFVKESRRRSEQKVAELDR